MSDRIGKSERETQQRVIELFKNELGYQYLGDWKERPNNSNIEEALLTNYLRNKAGYTPEQISAAIHQLSIEASNSNRNLYGNNQAVYKLLRYGVDVKTEAGGLTDKVHLINWQDPEANDFAIAEEVTLEGGHKRRPDLVLYLNGIAIGVIELKNSRVSIGDGIRQNLSNQKPEFNEWFFSTNQFVFAGNDSEGLRYGAILTPEKFFLPWKEDEHENLRLKLDKYLLKMCNKERLLELMYDFVLFDGGKKKLPRFHQYFGIKAAQRHVRKHQGGIIWHSQGTGKSIVMVLLAKWVLENNPNARVLVVTDRDALDKQIERVFTDSGESIERSGSSNELRSQLAEPKPRLLCSLVFKFGLQTDKMSDKQFADYIEKLKAEPSSTVGELFVFVDECHRTQSGRLHKLMTTLMPNAVFIGFTGTPLLKKDSKTSLEVFGSYIHTYKFSEAVEDEIILDLIYEARDIDQQIASTERVDEWFEAKTKGLNDWQRDELKSKWGTLQHVLSSKSRMDRVVSDIVFDFSTKPRLLSTQGNAMLVASSIYEACKYYTLLQKTEFKGKCAVVTSYNPLAKDITLEETGDNTETDKQFIYNTYVEILEEIKALPNMNKTETYEEQVKKKFVEEPANMQLLVVVDKLLTGFDAPSCSYLYIDKTMADHGLFQAICRTNRLDGDTKDFGYIVDYKDLFKKVENAIAVYTSEIDSSSEGASPEILLKDRLEVGKERLDNAIEALALLCEPVKPPAGELEHIHYFCGNVEIPTDLKEHEPQRTSLYKATVALIRSYANIADELSEAGYNDEEIVHLKERLNFYRKLRDVIRNAANETLDLKPYEADMRHLIDAYIEAKVPRKISPFDNIGLLDLIVKTGIADAIAGKLSNLGNNQDAIAETIENNVRSTLITKQVSDPDFYERMSSLLKEVISARRSRALAYEDYLKRIADIVKQIDTGKSEETPKQLDTPGKRAIYNLLSTSKITESDDKVELSIQIDKTIRKNRPDSWRGSQAKEHTIKGAIFEILQNKDLVEEVFSIIKAQGEY